MKNRKFIYIRIKDWIVNKTEIKMILLNMFSEVLTYKELENIFKALNKLNKNDLTNITLALNKLLK